MISFDSGSAPNSRCIRPSPWRIYALAGAAAMLLSASAQARPAPPQINPADVTADAKLSPAVSRALVQFVADYNAQNYDRASGDLAAARAIPGHTAYDDFRINSYGLSADVANRDYSGGASLLESMLASPSLSDRDRLSLYGSAISIYSGLPDYWRAIQFGERLNREGALDATSAAALAQAYLLAGSYADAERISQAALYKGAATDDQRKALNDVLQRAQINLGERQPSFGESLLGAMFTGATASLVQGMTGAPTVDPSTGLPLTPDQRKAAAHGTELQAQQRAATEVLAQNPASQRMIYSDLLDRSARLSRSDRKQAAAFHESASAAYQRQDYAGAAADLQNELALDPANGTANYYYADCLARGTNNSLVVIDYLARALTFDRSGEGGSQATEALRGIANPPQSNGQN